MLRHEGGGGLHKLIFTVKCSWKTFLRTSWFKFITGPLLLFSVFYILEHLFSESEDDSDDDLDEDDELEGDSAGSDELDQEAESMDIFY